MLREHRDWLVVAERFGSTTSALELATGVVPEQLFGIFLYILAETAEARSFALFQTSEIPSPQELNALLRLGVWPVSAWQVRNIDYRGEDSCPFGNESANVSKIAILDQLPMKTMSAKDAKNQFGLLLDTARAEPVTIQKHSRSVAVIISVEEYGRLVSYSALSTNANAIHDVVHAFKRSGFRLLLAVGQHAQEVDPKRPSTQHAATG
jgi:prevent-host-death family protein